MKITPIEIKQKTFEKGFRGYEKEEVEGFLRSLALEWEKLLDENKDLKKRLEAAEKEVQRLRDVENSLFKTLKSAEETGANLVDQANRAAELHIKEAQMKAEAVLNEARVKARNILEEADEKVKIAIGEAQEDLKNIIQEYQNVETQKESLLQSLEALAGETLERVERAKTKSRTGRELDKRFKELKSSIAERKNDVNDNNTAEVPQVVMQPLPKPKIQTPPAVEDDIRETATPKKENPSSEQGSFFDNLG